MAAGLGRIARGDPLLNFPVDDIDAAVAELSSRGISFERYPDTEQDDSAVMRAYGPPIAWFRDPAGNVLSVISLDD